MVGPPTLQRAYVLRFGSFSSLAYFIFNALTVAQSGRGRLNIGYVDEEITTTFIRRDKAISFLIIEKLYGTCRHVSFSFLHLCACEQAG